MVNLWGPGAFDCANPSAVQPPFVPDNAPGDVDDWFKDCSSPLDADGTEWRAALLNLLIANLRWVVRGSGTTASNTDPKLLPKAIQSGGMNYAIATGTANNWTVALTLALTAYVAGRVLWLKAPATNTNATVVVTIDGLAPRPLKKSDGSDPAVGDLVANSWYPTIDDGTNLCVVKTLASDILAQTNIAGRTEIFTASGTFIVPAISVEVEGWGAGGAGGASSDGTGNPAGAAGAGGGGGAYGYKRIFGLTPGSSIAVTIGAGGVGVGNASLFGGNGGSTSFGAHMTLAGGSGGRSGRNAAGLGGSGGAPTGADLGVAGGRGGTGGPTTAYNPDFLLHIWSKGGVPARPLTAMEMAGTGLPGSGYGAGGTGASGGSAVAGGNGAPGLLIVRW